MKIVFTGCAVLIGANLLNLLVPKFPEHQVVNVDWFTYATKIGRLRAIEESKSFRRFCVDITDLDAVVQGGRLGSHYEGLLDDG